MTTLDEILRSRVIAVIRGDYRDTAPALAEALVAGGVTTLEVTTNSPGVYDLIAELAERLAGRACVGAGTVLEPAQVASVRDAGGRFVVSPDTAPAVIGAALDAGLEPVPGALTPSEVRGAVRAGARLVKLFPAGLGGPDYLRQLRGPLHDVRFVPTGGVGLDDIGAYLAAGAVAVGVGGNLVPKRFDGGAEASAALTALARRFAEAAGAPRPGGTA